MCGLERRLERPAPSTRTTSRRRMARVAGEPLPERSDPEFASASSDAQRRGRRCRPPPRRASGRGERVRVRRMRPEGHTRCPRYVRGALGVIERVHGDDLLADAGARGEDATGRGGLRRALPLRRSLRRSRRAALPRARRPLGVAISRRPADARPRPRPRCTTTATTSGRRRSRSCARERSRRCSSSAASSPPTRSTPSSILRERRRAAERRPRDRARVGRSRVPRAAPAATAAAAIAELGYGGVEGDHMVVVENTPDVHNVIVCTLCSCYPWPVLGLPPAWYKSEAYRARVVAEPRRVLASSGSSSTRTSSCASGTRAPRCATSCCPSGPRAPTA